jgi:hypothetical protein
VNKSLGMYALIVVWNLLRILVFLMLFLSTAGVGFAAVQVIAVQA